MSGLVFVVIAVVVIIYFRNGNRTPNSRIVADDNQSYHNNSVSRSDRKMFRPTAKIGNIIVDEGNYLFEIRGVRMRTFSFHDVIKYELKEDGQTITSGGLSIGRALVGGALVGGVGAVLGGVTGNRKGKDVTTDMNIAVTMRGEHSGLYKINIIETKTRKSSKEYKNKVAEAEEIIALFDIALDSLE